MGMEVWNGMVEIMLLSNSNRGPILIECQGYVCSMQRYHYSLSGQRGFLIYVLWHFRYVT